MRCVFDLIITEKNGPRCWIFASYMTPFSAPPFLLILITAIRDDVMPWARSSHYWIIGAWIFQRTIINTVQHFINDIMFCDKNVIENI